MAKTLEAVRAQNLIIRMLEQISSDDPDYINKWMQQFDKQHGIKKAAPSSRSRRDGAVFKKAARAPPPQVNCPRSWLGEAFPNICPKELIFRLTNRVDQGSHSFRLPGIGGAGLVRDRQHVAQVQLRL